MDKEELLYRYFSKNLTPEQQRRFEELLATDTEFKEQFDFEKDLQGVIRKKQATDLKQKLTGFEKERAQNASGQNTPEQAVLRQDVSVQDIPEQDTSVKRLPNTDYRKWAIAASIALLVGLGWLGFNGLGTDYLGMYDENFEIYPNTVYTITRSDTDESIQRNAFVAYESGNYDKAISAFQKISENSQPGYLDFYLGQSYLKLGETNKAKTHFESVTASNGKFVAESLWYLALVSLKEERKDEALEYLRQLNSKYDYNKDRAVRLIEALK